MKKIIIFSVVSIFAILFFVLQPEKEKRKSAKSSLFKPKIVNELQSPLPPKTQEKMVVLDENFKKLKSLSPKSKAINKKNKNWPQKTVTFLEQNSDFDREIQIDDIQDIVITAGDKHIYLGRASLQFKQPDGSSGKMEIIINPENGDIIHSFGHDYNKDIEKDIDIKNYYPAFDRVIHTASIKELIDLKKRVDGGDFNDIDKSLPELDKINHQKKLKAKSKRNKASINKEIEYLKSLSPE
jgi:hypothetical protein